jgi:hypothetical protein
MTVDGRTILECMEKDFEDGPDADVLSQYLSVLLEDDCLLLSLNEEIRYNVCFLNTYQPSLKVQLF